MKDSQPPMRPDLVVCPHTACGTNDRIGVHSQKERRYICHRCHKTFAETVGTLFYGLKYPIWMVVIILTLLAYGCPVPAIVAAFAIDERTVAEWQRKAGDHGERIQADLVCNGQIELGQVQQDGLCINAQGFKAWIATGMTVFSRLFMGSAALTTDLG